MDKYVYNPEQKLDPIKQPPFPHLLIRFKPYTDDSDVHSYKRTDAVIAIKKFCEKFDCIESTVPIKENNRIVYQVGDFKHRWWKPHYSLRRNLKSKFGVYCKINGRWMIKTQDGMSYDFRTRGIL